MDFKTGDKVEVHSHDFYLGKGVICSFSRYSNIKLANVETFDGTHYSVSMSEIIKIED